MLCTKMYGCICGVSSIARAAACSASLFLLPDPSHTTLSVRRSTTTYGSQTGMWPRDGVGKGFGFERSCVEPRQHKPKTVCRHAFSSPTGLCGCSRVRGEVADVCLCTECGTVWLFMNGIHAHDGHAHDGHGGACQCTEMHPID